MRALAAGGALAFLLALLLTPLVRRLAHRLGALDPFSARKVLGPSTVPRLGGLGIAAAFYLTLLVLWRLDSTLARAVLARESPVRAILAGGFPILVLGVVDDLRGLRALPKLVVEVLLGLGLWAAGLRVFGESSFGLELGGALSCVVTVAWLVGVVNAVNLIDGLDGLASGTALFSLGTLAVAAVARGDLLLALLAVVLCGAVLGFLVFNWSPASIFMGDTGSLFLGYVLATTSVWSVSKAATLVLAVFPVVALGLPILDTSLTISRRLLAGRPVMQADRDHVHHRLLGRGAGVPRTVLTLYGVCAVFSGLSLVMLLGDRGAARLALLCAVLFALGLGYGLGYLRGGPHGLWTSDRRRRRNRQILRGLERLPAELASGRETLAAVLARIGAALGSPGAPLPLRIVPPAPEPDAEPAGPAVTRYPIGTQDALRGWLEIARPEAQLGPDERTLLQALCDALAPALGPR